MLISVSLLNSKDKILDTKKLNKLNVDYFHIDVMDNTFVPQKSFPFREIKRVSKVSDKKLDIHLMVEDPIPYIKRILKLSNINNITIHLELEKDIKSILLRIKEKGIKCGLAIKPDTNIEDLKPYLDIIDLILIMTVEPGLGGQPFIESSIDRINKIKSLVNNHNILLEVDGGINNQTIDKVKEANIAVVGSYITTSDNMEEKVNSLYK